MLILDPLKDDWGVGGERVFQTDDPDEFLRAFWQSRSCDVFIDEAGDTIGHYEKAMVRTATRGRHWGHNCHYITQRAATLSPTVRAQCRYIFLFALARQDCEVYAREFNRPELIQASQLAQFECYFAARFHGTVQKFNILGGKGNESITDTRRTDSDSRHNLGDHQAESGRGNVNGGEATETGE